MILTEFPDLAGVLVGSPVGTSDHSTMIIDVVRDQSIPPLLCMQEVYLKNSVDWRLVRRDGKGLNWNMFIRSSCPTSPLFEALLSVIRDRISKLTVAVRTSDKLWFDDLCVLTHRAQQKVYRVWSRLEEGRLTGRSIGWFVMLSLCMWMLNKQLRCEVNQSCRMHQI